MDNAKVAVLCGFATAFGFCVGAVCHEVGVREQQVKKENTRLKLADELFAWLPPAFDALDRSEFIMQYNEKAKFINLAQRAQV